MPESATASFSPDHREREIFLHALEISSSEARAEYVAQACGSDVTLRAAVQGLLANHREDAFLETPAVDPLRLNPTERGSAGTEILIGFTKPGDHIGRYKLLQEIGEGACGTVYMAEQEEPVRRRVALKIIKPGMDSKSVIARFEAERQALALMDHPNIAKVFDAGTTDTGRPFFVMELVRGIRITEYCDQNQLSTGERLNLFVKVCNAIQHAHQKGIIHRDIKPSNILVTLHDGVPVPKVIDFGIAKAIEQRLTEKTVFTHFAAFIGTPAYTSPEQAEMSGLDIDTRSDIYSLGVLLYELMTGETPFDPQHLIESGLDEMRRIIREEEPDRPSTRLSTLGMADAATLTVARQSAIPALVQALKGDLDWIVMKCLEKDRTRRYPTANALAQDVQRYLDREPVLARPPTPAYRLRKFVARNRVTVGAGALVAVVLLGAAIVSTWLAVRARLAEREEALSRRMAEAAQANEAIQRRLAERQSQVALRQAYASDMNLVQQALAANNYGRVIELLDRHRPQNSGPTYVHSASPPADLRQWEWRYFWSQSLTEELFALPRQTTAINAIALSPNGRLAAVADRSGAITLWDLSERSAVATLREPTRQPGPGGVAFAFSRDGSRLAFTAEARHRRGEVTVLTVATRQVLCRLALESSASTIAFTADDGKLLVCGSEGLLTAWDLETQQPTGRIKLPTPGAGWRPLACVFSPDAKWLALRSDETLEIVNAATGEVRSSIATADQISSLAFAPDGETLALGPFLTGTSTNIKLFSASTGQEIGELAGHVSWVPSLVFTPDGKRLVSAGADQLIRVWDLATFGELASFRGHRSEVNCVAVAPDGTLAVSGCKDGTILAWDLRHLQRNEPFETLGRPISSLEFFSDSRRMLTVNGGGWMGPGTPPRDEGTVTLWDTGTLRELEQVAALGDDVTRLVLAPDGSRVYAGSRSGQVRVLDWATRLVVTNVAPKWAAERRERGPGFGGPGLSTTPLAVVDQGRTLVLQGPGPVVRSLDTETWAVKSEWKLSDPGRGMWLNFSVSPDEKTMVVSHNSTIEFRNLASGEIEASLAAQTLGVTGSSFSPDGKLLATSSVDGSVNLWDTTRHQVVDVLRGHLLGLHAVAFSPDGERLASASVGSEAVKLWDVATRHELATLSAQGGAILHTAKFSPDGRLLVTINLQGTASIWRAPSPDEIARVEADSSRRQERPADLAPSKP